MKPLLELAKVLENIKKDSAYNTTIKHNNDALITKQQLLIKQIAENKIRIDKSTLINIRILLKRINHNINDKCSELLTIELNKIEENIQQRINTNNNKELTKNNTKKNMTMTEETTFNLLSQVTELWQAELKAELNEYNLTILEFTILSSMVYLTQKNNEITQVTLGTYTHIKPMNVSVLLRKLEARKFLQRQEHPIDTRAKIITITPLCEEVVTKVLNGIDQIAVHFFNLSKSEITALNKKLKQIRDGKMIK